MADHTPTLWHADGDVIWVETVEYEQSNECCVNLNRRGECCGDISSTAVPYPAQEQIGQASEGDAEFIVKAVNSYDSSRALIAELVAALERLLRAFESDVEQVPNLTVRMCWSTNSMAIKDARAALAKAKAAQP